MHKCVPVGVALLSEVVSGEGGGFSVGDRVRGAVNIFLKAYKMSILFLDF
jgi:hypothetical protein